jgi:predicted ester cyclase
MMTLWLRTEFLKISQLIKKEWRSTITKCGEPFPDAKYEFEHVVVDGNEAACMFSITGIQKDDLLGIPPSDKQLRINGMIFFRFKDSKIVERWEIIDLLSAAKQLGARQQLSAVKNAILEYGEVQANAQLKDKINSLFKKHLTWIASAIVQIHLLAFPELVIEIECAAMIGSIGIIVILTSSLSVALLHHRFGRLNSSDIICDKPIVIYVIDPAVVD